VRENVRLRREGYAYVGISAQRVGVQEPPSGLTAWSPTRYGTLDVTAGNTVPSDTLSYDIFSQAAQAIRHPVGVNPLGGLPVRLIIAAGVSQSQGRLVAYHNSIHPLAGVYDGFYLVLGLGLRLRTDLAVKVFKVNTGNDVLLLGEAAARQPDARGKSPVRHTSASRALCSGANFSSATASRRRTPPCVHSQR